MPNVSQPHIRAVERAVAVLKSLERAQRPLRLKEISEDVGLHNATTSRVLATLEAANFVVEDDQRYRLGADVLRLAHGYLVNDPLSQFARPVMQRLTQETTLTSTLYLLSGLERLLSVRVDGAEPMQYQQPIGRWLPLYVGSGRTIAAFMDEASQERIAELGTGHRTTSGRELLRETILEEFAEVRATHHAMSIGERDRSIASASVPLFVDGAIVGCLSLTGPSDTTSRDQLEAVLPALRGAGEEISRMRSYG